ncbi:MAG: ABC transporter permease [Chromatiales bacterium]|nr:ABC transporter permease [Chromatiales bacterium]MDH3933218.1 ABC transporter permease [Chromatiales bacterium]MDH4014210.1 ABC transporter permease [Chromatiales bacterium]
MRALDATGFAFQSLRRTPARSGLMLLAMGIGVAAVMVLTALGEGARRYVTGEFSSLGTNLVIVIPGRSETTGASPALFAGETPRDLTVADAAALTRSALVSRVAPIMVGSAAASYGSRTREVPVIGSTADMLEVRHWKLAAGGFLPRGDWGRGATVCVIGEKIRSELFGAGPAVGQWLRIGDWRFRVIGVLASEGRSIGVDVQELVVIPVASAEALFNSQALFRVLVEARSREAMPRVTQWVLDTLRERHQGEEDVTVITQDAVLATFDRIFQALTMTLGGIAAISLGVAGILIMNVMLVAVSQRTAEIGLLKALGADRRQIILLFLVEAVLLSVLGAVVGMLAGAAGSWGIGRIYPALDVVAPGWAIGAAAAVAIITGLVFGIMPARRAAQLDPIRALAG